MIAQSSSTLLVVRLMIACLVFFLFFFSGKMIGFTKTGLCDSEKYIVGGVGVFRLNKLPGSLLCLDDHYNLRGGFAALLYTPIQKTLVQEEIKKMIGNDWPSISDETSEYQVAKIPGIGTIVQAIIQCTRSV